MPMPMPLPAIDYSRLTGTICDRETSGRLRAVVAGAGALGNEVARLLGLLGVASVTVVDPDRVEPSNLTRSLLFRTENRIGMNKAEALARASREFFPDTLWRFLPVAMADAGLLRFADSDVIFGCVDSDLARIEITVAAHKTGKPVIDGGLGDDGDATGRISFYAGAAHACYACQLFPADRARALAGHHQKRFSCATLPEANSGPRPSTPALASMVAALQVDRAFRFLQSGAPAESRSLELRLDGEAQLSDLRIRRDPECPLHENPGRNIPVASASARFIDLLYEAGCPRGSVLLDWPVCTDAVCRGCGARWRPMRRLALVRGAARCPACGSTAPTALQATAEISAESEFALMRLADFGLPDEQIVIVAGESEARN